MLTRDFKKLMDLSQIYTNVRRLTHLLLFTPPSYSSFRSATVRSLLSAAGVGRMPEFMLLRPKLISIKLTKKTVIFRKIPPFSVHQASVFDNRLHRTSV